MSKFAKLYEHPTIGQILVKLDRSNDDSEPEIRFFFTPTNLGVRSVAIVYEDTDSGWDKAETYFNAVDYETAVARVEPFADEIISPFCNKEGAA